MQIASILTREDQLGGALSHSVHESRRADFSMLLAMLSQDALEFSQFHLPEEEQLESNKSEAALKKSLQIGPQQTLAPKHYDMLIGQSNAAHLSKSSMVSLRLQQCLNPEPLAVRNDKNHIPLVVVDNCEVSVRNRLQRAKDEMSTVDRPTIDAVAMYEHLASEQMQNALAIGA